MEPFIRIFREVIIDNYISIVILTFGWIPIYIIKKLLDWSIVKILIRLPISISVLIWRMKYAKPFQNKYNDCPLDILPFDPIEKKKKVAKYSIMVDKILSNIVINKHSIVRVLFEPSNAVSEARNTMKHYVGILDSDYSFFDALSTDWKSAYRGILSYSNSPYITREQSVKFLISRLRYLEISHFIKVVYILATKVKTKSELSEIVVIIESRGDDFKHRSSNIIRKISQNVMVNTPITNKLNQL